MSKSALCIFFSNCTATSWEISSVTGLFGCPIPLLPVTCPPLCELSPSGVWVLIPFPFPFPFPFHFLFPFSYSSDFPFTFPLSFSVTFPFTFPVFILFAFPLPFLLPRLSSSHLPSSLPLQWPGWFLPPLSDPGSTKLQSSSSWSVISSQFSSLTARRSPGLYCWKLGISIVALRSLLLYKEKHWTANVSFPKLFVCRLEQLTWSSKVWGLSHRQLFIWLWGLPIIGPINEQTPANHYPKGDYLLLRCGHIRWNHDTWQVVTWLKKIYIIKEVPCPPIIEAETVCIRLNPQMCSGMNPSIQSRSNEWRWFWNDAGLFAPAVALPIPLLLPIDAIAVSWKLISICAVTMIILFRGPEASPEETYNVVYVIECVLERKASNCASHTTLR